MLTGIYRLLLRLYPDNHRSEFGEEMVSVFEQAKAEAAGKGAGHSLTFIVHEFSGLVLDAFQAQMQMVPISSEPWIWSLEAPIAAILLYSFWVWRSEEMGMRGFFFPAPIWWSWVSVDLALGSSAANALCSGGRAVR